MEGGMGFDGNSNISLVLHSERLPHSSEVLESLWVPNSSPSFHGENQPQSGPFFSAISKEENCDDVDYDRSFHQPEKKRRLSAHQVQFLEKSFEVENKLEPERKVQLAKELNLQPRQVAIWFQNRRARYKTKQLEKDYDLLRGSYDELKLDFDKIQQENEKLKHEVQLLKENLRDKENGGPQFETSLPMINSTEEKTRKMIPFAISEDVSKFALKVFKQEAANSAKSDVLDSDSTHYTDANNQSSFLEPTADSSQGFEPADHSDFSQDDEDNFSREFLRPPRFPKLEEESYVDLSISSCNLEYPVDEPEQPLWFWP